MVRLPILMVGLLACAPALAGETPWQEVMPEVSIRLVSTDNITADGTVWVALEIDMPATTKTYWRVPGESGIPPRLDFSASSDIGAHTIAWPYPQRSVTDAYLDHAYYGHTVLPIELEITGDTPAVSLSAVLGICSDICVPVSADFSLEIDADEPDRANTLRVQQALAKTPIEWEGEELIGDIRLAEDHSALIAETEDATFPVQTAIADIAGRPMLFGPPEIDGAELRFPLLGKARGDLTEGEHVHITFMGSDGPYEIIKPLRLPAS
jgi:DsbC/DsbD-like thiol-disulfide interchange protein